MNFATAVVLAALIACVCLSIRSLRRKGTCGHKERCGGGCSECAGCSTCASADEMATEVRERLACKR